MQINTVPKHPEHVQRLHADYYIEVQARMTKRVELTPEGELEYKKETVRIIGDEDSYILFRRDTNEPIARIEATSLGHFIIQKLAATYASVEYDQTAFEALVTEDPDDFGCASEYENNRSE